MLQYYQLEKAPKPGKKVLLGNYEAVFLSTLHSVPELNANLTGVPIQCVLSQNTDYMDIGAGDIDHNVSGALLRYSDRKPNRPKLSNY